MKIAASFLILSAFLINAYLGSSGFDSDAQDFFDRIATNSGTISAGTKTAVNTFVTVAKANGYWSKLDRINLVCGDQLAAAQVPLKVGAGSSVDTGNSVSGDYTESTGIHGNTTYIITGAIPTSYSGGNFHCSFYGTGLDGTGNQSLMGAYSDSGTGYSGFWFYLNGTSIRFYCDTNFFTGGEAEVVASPFTSTGFYIGNQTATNDTRIYKNGSQIGSTSTNTAGTSAFTFVGSIIVLCENNNGAFQRYSSAYCRGYSIGTGLTTQNITDFNTDLEAFNDALSRGVQ